MSFPLSFFSARRSTVWVRRIDIAVACILLGLSAVQVSAQTATAPKAPHSSPTLVDLVNVTAFKMYCLNDTGAFNGSFDALNFNLANANLNLVSVDVKDVGQGTNAVLKTNSWSIGTPGDPALGVISSIDARNDQGEVTTCEVASLFMVPADVQKLLTALPRLGAPLDTNQVPQGTDPQQVSRGGGTVVRWQVNLPNTAASQSPQVQLSWGDHIMDGVKIKRIYRIPQPTQGASSSSVPPAGQ